jgi:DmsE family decaheme c-type cytochrome
VKPTVNQTCYTCHAEKRGPFLWEHAPVAEDCTLCHFPHGSSRPVLLSKSPPLLCQQCHTVAGHPSVAYTSRGLPGGGGGGGAFLLAGGCVNCHSQVHGSNHPSGVKLMR